MKKNKFQQQQDQQSQQQVKNYFDDDNDVDVEEETLNERGALQASKPYEEYFQKFNDIYNEYVSKFQKFEEDHQIPLTQPDYESLIQTHFLCYEKNMGLFDFVKSDNKLFDKICASFVYIDSQIYQIEELVKIDYLSQFYSNYLDKMTIYGELSDLHTNVDQQLKDGEAQIMIARMLGMFKAIYEIIKKIINYVTHLVNQLNLLYNKKDPIHKQTFKHFNLFYPLDTIGRALSMIYVLDQVVEQNDFLQQHWNFYKTMIKIIKPDSSKYNTNEQNFKNLEKILIRLDKTVLSGSCLQGVLNQNWDAGVSATSQQQKTSNIPPIKNNKEFHQLFEDYFKDRIETFEKTIGGSKEVFERNQILQTLCVYALFRKLYTAEEDRDLWKNLWAIQKKVPFIEGHSQVLCYISKFMLEVVPLNRKSKNMDPKDPIEFVKAYLKRLEQNFCPQLANLYTQFTAWLVRVDSFATSQASFTGIERLNNEKAQAVVEDRMSQRVTLIMNGLIIAAQVNNLIKALLLGTFGMEEQCLDKAVIQDIVLALQMLKAIEYYIKEKYDAFQPAFLNREITKKAPKILGPAIIKAKSNIKSSGGADILACLQMISNILKTAISPIKLLTLQYCMNFAISKECFKDQDREDMKYILFQLDKIVLLPYYVRKVTSSTYFYWCKDLLPLFFQNIYNNPPSAKRFQFLFNAVSDCSRQLDGCVHLTNPNELYDSFRKFVVQEFNQQYLNPLARDIEDFLRIQVHTVLIDKIQGVNPFKKQVKDIKRLLDVDQVLIFDSVVNIRGEINQNLNETFYNINVLNMYDMETYEQMRSLANFKFGLQLMNVYLPSQTIDQGSFDVLNIIKNIQSFVSRYTYNLYTQTFSQITTESKQLYSIGISQISDSIRTHGLGILNTNINSVYIYIRKKIEVFSHFLFDDYIQSPLIREDQYFKQMKDQLDGLYPFERAEGFYKEVKKLGVFDDGKNFLDKFRILITNVGNALGQQNKSLFILRFLRLLRSASLNFCSKNIEFLPHGYEKEQSFAEHSTQANFSESTQEAAKELDDVFAFLKGNFSDRSDYLRMLVKVFEAIRGGDNKHLKLFYLILPALTLNFIENMLMAKERLNKKNSVDCFITDDGFVMGLQYFLSLLDQRTEFDSLHWRKEIKTRFQKEIGAAKSIVQKGTQQSQRVADEINMQKELSLRKLNMQMEEYQMLFYAFNASKILFMEK